MKNIKTDHDRVTHYISTVDHLDNEEVAMFHLSTQELTAMNSLTQENYEWLKKEFDTYIKKLRLVYQKKGADYLLADFFEDIAGNGWMIIRREIISRALKKEAQGRSFFH